MDPETRSFLQVTIATEVGLPPQLAARLAGETIGELRSDARALHRELFGGESQARGPDGKFGGSTDMSTLIRQRARRVA